MIKSANWRSKAKRKLSVLTELLPLMYSIPISDACTLFAFFFFNWI